MQFYVEYMHTNYYTSEHLKSLILSHLVQYGIPESKTSVPTEKTFEPPSGQL